MHGFFAAAEGLTPAGLFETRPISPLFIDTYFTLLRNGLEPVITPMNFPDSFRLHNEWKLGSPSTPKLIRGRVGKKIASSVVQRLRAVTGEARSLGILLRAIWHRQFVTDSTHLISSPSVEELEQMITRRYWGRLSENKATGCL